MRAGKHDQNLAPRLEVRDLRVGSGEMAEQCAMRPRLAAIHEGQMAGDQAVIAKRDERRKAVALDHIGEDGRIAFAEVFRQIYHVDLAHRRLSGASRWKRRTRRRSTADLSQDNRRRSKSDGPGQTTSSDRGQTRLS